MYKCIKKCQLQPSKYNFADQKYLDQIPKKFKKVQVLEKNIFNIVPWNFDNLGKYNYKSKETKIVFFHFQGLKFISKNLFYLGLNNYSVRDIQEIRKIYYFYCLELKNILIKNNIDISYNFFQTIKFFFKGIFQKDLIYIK